MAIAMQASRCPRCRATTTKSPTSEHTFSWRECPSQPALSLQRSPAHSIFSSGFQVPQVHGPPDQTHTLCRRCVPLALRKCSEQRVSSASASCGPPSTSHPRGAAPLLCRSSTGPPSPLPSARCTPRRSDDPQPAPAALQPRRAQRRRGLRCRRRRGAARSKAALLGRHSRSPSQGLLRQVSMSREVRQNRPGVGSGKLPLHSRRHLGFRDQEDHPAPVRSNHRRCPACYPIQLPHVAAAELRPTTCSQQPSPPQHGFCRLRSLISVTDCPAQPQTILSLAPVPPMHALLGNLPLLARFVTTTNKHRAPRLPARPPPGRQGLAPRRGSDLNPGRLCHPSATLPGC
mmetsp:Transcript_132437/g.423903  ORF Transcript_132437/g.423903 Transcript_132437/m.423903 type:complete len:345 (+) Transcript_132437:202-1236(+)